MACLPAWASRCVTGGGGRYPDAAGQQGGTSRRSLAIYGMTDRGAQEAAPGTLADDGVNQ